MTKEIKVLRSYIDNQATKKCTVAAVCSQGTKKKKRQKINESRNITIMKNEREGSNCKKKQ